MIRCSACAQWPRRFVTGAQPPIRKPSEFHAAAVWDLMFIFNHNEVPSMRSRTGAHRRVLATLGALGLSVSAVVTTAGSASAAPSSLHETNVTLLHG